MKKKVFSCLFSAFMLDFEIIEDEMVVQFGVPCEFLDAKRL
jgi:hypothetical protein